MRIAYYTFFALLVLSTSCKKKNYDPSGCLSAEEQKKILYTMMHYASRLAPEATHETKFDKKFDWYYDRAVNEARVLYCDHNEENDTYSLLVARKARSITPMEEGIAVRIKLGENDTFADYEEVFRMWKMHADSVEKKGKFLFRTMLEGGDLTLYYTQFRKDEFIEFPDQRFTFDKKIRRWRDSAMDTIQFQ
ncbi:hypothetical protein [Parachryseolinea silvisoli]|uniref:hypothetical protein n=1 Tax=Parachryseolinea silvisoli TaxID=2873601 RepID=UPI00226598A0|nr:hypothetical protein [Parachryseolinea silvisoli]MCD9016444.1 hypothetical protein [Parachryseolinea silvisoli]